MKYFIGVFYILHGLVYLLYMGHILNQFELEKGFMWPYNSRFLADFFNSLTIKMISSVLCVIAAVSFVASGICVLIGYSRHNLGTIVAIITSTTLFIAF